jgi:hypothetical protein
MKEAAKTSVVVFLSVLSILSILSVTSAIATSMSERTINGNSGCIYKSYISKYNPPYRAVCELLRDRTLSNKEDIR